MAYPERKPIYKAYEAIVKKIVDEKLYKEYAEAEIEDVNSDLLRQFEMIAAKIVYSKFGEKLK